MLIGTDTAVLGAGIAGLSVARALALRGAKVTVYERAKTISEVGAGLQISPNGVAVLKALGLAPEVVATRSDGVRLLNGFTGRTVLSLDFAKYKPDATFLMMHRADLIGLLANGAWDAGVDLEMSRAVSKVDQTPDGATINFEDGSSVHHTLVVGADGFNSKLRPELNGAAPAQYSGHTAWRAVVPARGGEDRVALVHMAKGKHVVTYPLRGGSLINIVAVEETGTWSEEGWHIKGDPNEMRKRFSGLAAGVSDVLSRVDSVARWGLFRHPVARRWFGPHVALVGDAAHPTLPFLAQGANMALEDAWVLADCLAALPMDQALPMYQARRHERVTKVIDAATANARNYHLHGPARYAAHSALRLSGKVAPRAAIDRFSWLYDYDVTSA